MKLPARVRRRLGPLGAEIPETIGRARSPAEKRDGAALRAALTRFETKHGADALISILKTELQVRGEERWRLDALAPKPGVGGQTSILDAGR